LGTLQLKDFRRHLLANFKPEYFDSFQEIATATGTAAGSLLHQTLKARK